MPKDPNKHAKKLLDELTAQGVVAMSMADVQSFVNMRYGSDPELAGSLTVMANQIAASLGRGIGSQSAVPIKRGSPSDPNNLTGDFTKTT